MIADTTLKVGADGEVTIPAPVAAAYGLQPDSQVRLLQVSAGLLLVPLTANPPDTTLAEELASWQDLSAETLRSFPYDL